MTLLLHPLALVTLYVIVADPAATPVTTPVALIVAIAVDELLHTPPLVASVRVVVLPTQTVFVPPMAAGVDGRALIVTATFNRVVLSQVFIV